MQPCISKKYCFLKINYCFSIIYIYLHQTNQSTLPTMSKIKILNWILKGLILITTLGIALNIYLYYSSLQHDRFFNSLKINAFYYHYISPLQSILFLSSIICLKISIGSFIKHNFFNSKSVKYLKHSGVLLLVYSLAGIAFTVIFVLANKSLKDGFPDMDSMAYLFKSNSHIATLIIAIGIFIVADIVKSGVTIKQENELTI